MERRPTIAVIDREALRHNYRQIRSKVREATKVLAVVKANAYGHGDVETAAVLQDLGCENFGVAMSEEGIRLRESGISRPILILGGVFPNQLKDVFEAGLTPVAFDLNTVRLINEFASKKGLIKNIHLKLDTGMGRLGIRSKDAAGLVQALSGARHIRLEGVLSHFAEAEEEDKSFSKKQLDEFLKTVQLLRDAGINPPLLHMANSAAIIAPFLSPSPRVGRVRKGAVDYKDAEFNLVRPGLMLYGAYPSERLVKKLDLKPVLALKTRVLSLKNIDAGSSISYGRRFVAKRNSVIAVLPIGYADGYMRSLSNKSSVLIRGKRAPVAGGICMDLTMCDVTDIPDVREHDEAVLIGSQGSERITAEEIASLAGTIPYELLCGISARVPRVYIS